MVRIMLMPQTCPLCGTCVARMSSGDCPACQKAIPENPENEGEAGRPADDYATQLGNATGPNSSTGTVSPPDSHRPYAEAYFHNVETLLRLLSPIFKGLSFNGVPAALTLPHHASEWLCRASATDTEWLSGITLLSQLSSTWCQQVNWHAETILAACDLSGIPQRTDAPTVLIEPFFTESEATQLLLQAQAWLGGEVNFDDWKCVARNASGPENFKEDSGEFLCLNLDRHLQIPDDWWSERRDERIVWVATLRTIAVTSHVAAREAEVESILRSVQTKVSQLISDATALALSATWASKAVPSDEVFLTSCVNDVNESLHRLVSNELPSHILRQVLTVSVSDVLKLYAGRCLMVLEIIGLCDRKDRYTTRLTRFVFELWHLGDDHAAIARARAMMTANPGDGSGSAFQTVVSHLDTCLNHHPLRVNANWFVILPELFAAPKSEHFPELPNRATLSPQARGVRCLLWLVILVIAIFAFFYFRT